MTVNNAPKAAARFNDVIRDFRECYQKASKLLIPIKLCGITLPISFEICKRKEWVSMIWKDEWHWTPYTQDESSPWLILTVRGGWGKTNWDDKEAWGCFKNRQQEDEPLKKKGETRLSIVAWTIAELERWPPPPHATMSLFIYPVHHAAFPVTTGGGSRPCSAEAGAVRLIHCKRHLPACFVMFPDATCKAWLARNYGPDAAFTLFVYPFRYTVIPQKLCHWCSERGLAQKCG